MQCSQGLHRILHQIRIAYGNSAARQDQLTALACVEQRVFDGCGIVGQSAQVFDLNGQAGQQRGDCATVGIVDLAISKFRSRRLQFIPGGEQGDAWPGKHLQCLLAAGRQRADAQRVQWLTLGNHPFAPAQIMAGLAHMIPGLGCSTQANRIAFAPAFFLNGHGIAGGRQGSAGRDAGASAILHPPGEGMAGQARPHDLERLNAGPPAKRIAIHGRSRERGQIRPGWNILRGHSAPSFGKSCPLPGAGRWRQFKHLRQCGIQGEGRGLRRAGIPAARLAR